MNLTVEADISTEKTDSAAPPGMKVINGHLARSLKDQGLLTAPNQRGYIHLAGEVEPLRVFQWRSKQKERFLSRFKSAIEQLKADHADSIVRADLFDAFLVPPGAPTEAMHDLHRWGLKQNYANFDVVLLVECHSIEAAREVRRTKSFRASQDLLEEAAANVHCITARNSKRIADVDKDRDGVFLFNYFVAADYEENGVSGSEMMSAVWEYTAGWWTANVNLTNSTPLIVLANFRANKIVAMPDLYRLA